MSTYEQALQRSLAVTCMYCKRENRPDECMFIVRRATKPRNHFNRWVSTGEYCCDDCAASGKPYEFGYYLNEGTQVPVVIG